MHTYSFKVVHGESWSQDQLGTYAVVVGALSIHPNTFAAVTHLCFTHETACKADVIKCHAAYQ